MNKSKTGGTTTDGPKSTTFHISVFPGLAFDLTNRLQLQTSIGLFNLNYSSSVTTTVSGNQETKDKSSSFGFGAGLDNIINIGAITVGAILKF